MKRKTTKRRERKPKFARIWSFIGSGRAYCPASKLPYNRVVLRAIDNNPIDPFAIEVLSEAGERVCWVPRAAGPDLQRMLHTLLKTGIANFGVLSDPTRYNNAIDLYVQIP